MIGPRVTISVLLRRSYGTADQAAFARLSGDFNPLHMDPVAARRTIVGAPAVHGINIVLSALDALLTRSARDGSAAGTVTRVKARLAKPVRVGDEVIFRIEEQEPGDASIGAYVEGELVAEIRAWLCKAERPHDEAPSPLAPVRLHDLNFSELAGHAGVIELGIDPELPYRLFPGIVAAMGLGGLSEIVALSRLVGMRCPGLYSLLAEFDIELAGSDHSGRMEFSVDRVDPRFRLVDMIVKGGRARGRVRAVCRPPPQVQSSMADAARHVGRQEFAGRTALIVGGGRGLGEATAKVLAAGGGKPIITFHRGTSDARQVASEIEEWGGSCDLMQLDVLHGDAAYRELFGTRGAPGSIYYFATPKIFGRRRGFFSYDLFREFVDYYVIAFGRLIEAAAQAEHEKIRVFYPSSMAVEEHPQELAEYAMAKRAGEDLCRFYNRHSGGVRILVDRLPRLKTDQTATLLEAPAGDCLASMVPIVRRIEAGAGF